jgi:putative oxidoreductase
MQTELMQNSLLKRFVSVDRTSRKLSHSIILIRILVAFVFLSEGIQKFLFSDALGVGRFIKIGIPMPEITAPFVGIVEIACGSFILFGLYTRLAALLLIINMLVAILTTKIPILLEKGFWAMAHEARVDWSMIVGSLFLLIVGSGRWSLDDIRGRKSENQKS